MTNIHFIVLVLISIVGLQSCQDKLENPNYSEIPRIELQDVKIIKGQEEFNFQDTLRVLIRFRDGNTDLGLSYSDEDSSPQFTSHNFLRNRNGDPIKFNPKADTFSCESFFISYDSVTIQLPDGESVTLDRGDTVRYERNKYVNNLHIQLFREELGNFIEFNLLKLCVPPLGGRFPRIDSLPINTLISTGVFNIFLNTPWEGTIEYKRPIGWLKSLFKNDPIKIKVHINDRALNESNVVESAPFTFE